MYERSYGTKYEQSKHLGHDYSEIAKLIRADIKAAVLAGDLPDVPADYSVTSESYAGGGAIRIKVINHTDLWQDCTGIVPGSEQEFPGGGYSAQNCGNIWCAAHGDSVHHQVHQVLTVEGRRVRTLLEQIHGAYNYNGSESQVDYFDVRYYGHPEIEDERDREWRLREAARKAEARKNAAAKAEIIDRLVPRGYKRGKLRNKSYEQLVEFEQALIARDQAVRV